MSTVKAFNAFGSLQHFNPEPRKRFQDLKVGGEYSFHETSIQRVSNRDRQYYPVVETDNGIECASDWVAQLPVFNRCTSVLNTRLDKLFHCTPTIKTSKLGGRHLDILFNHISEDHPFFPRIRIEDKLPEAIHVSDIERENRPTYEEYFQMRFDDLCDLTDYLPLMYREERGKHAGRIRVKSIPVVTMLA